MTNEQERAEFEAWALAKWPGAILSPDQNNCGIVIPERYKHPKLQAAWEAYQAGRAALQSQKPEPDVTGLVEARGETMRFALSEMVKWYENISLGYNPAFQYYDLAKKALLSAALQSQVESAKHKPISVEELLEALEAMVDIIRMDGFGSYQALDIADEAIKKNTR